MIRSFQDILLSQLEGKLCSGSLRIAGSTQNNSWTLTEERGSQELLLHKYPAEDATAREVPTTRASMASTASIESWQMLVQTGVMAHGATVFCKLLLW